MMRLSCSAMITLRVYVMSCLSHLYINRKLVFRTTISPIQGFRIQLGAFPNLKAFCLAFKQKTTKWV
ncbi:hypothetical protein FGO68_gene8807 [Halteria grandinella]|uniref:Uncharacterized protein n=1 Tax=Halteria grandinella TaxID=5974 RepID=A0A8J8NFZ6_HALGN|nr:hypothetical protein FGO68_gene8807 [Halteria grandinella]